MHIMTIFLFCAIYFRLKCRIHNSSVWRHILTRSASGFSFDKTVMMMMMMYKYRGSLNLEEARLAFASTFVGTLLNVSGQPRNLDAPSEAICSQGSLSNSLLDFESNPKILSDQSHCEGRTRRASLTWRQLSCDGSLLAIKTKQRQAINYSVNFVRILC